MKTENLRIVFMGTPGFAVGVLSTLVSNNYNVVGVVTAPDRPKGRGRSLQGSEVKQFALQHNINVLQPTNLKDASFLQELKNLAPTLQIVVAFRMLPKVVWQIPSLGTFNLHASLLPQYRGAAPINWAIINKEQTTGVTTFFIDEKIDTGEIILSQKVTIAEDETVGSLHDVLMDIGSQLVIETIEIIKKGDLSTTPQPLGEDFSSLQLQEAPKLTPNKTYIDWCATPETIDHFVRGLNPYPCAWSFLEQEGEKIKVKIYKVALIKPEHENSLWFITKDAGIKISEHSQLGAVKEIHKKLYVQLHNQVLEIIEIQLPGKRKMLTKDLVNGYDFMPDAKMIVNPHA
jgi:methionyl-tRNA formyltransferase